MLLSMPQDMLCFTSTNFVALIVLLRLLAVKQPLGFQAAHEKLVRYSRPIIWGVTSLIPLIGLILSIQLPNTFAYWFYLSLQLDALYALPIFSTIIMYFVLLHTLKQKREEVIIEATRMRLRTLAKMTKGIVVGLVVCNLPYLVWLQTYLALWCQNNGTILMENDFGVRLIS